ncbi:MAG: leucyl aminopeptidase [Acidimicrobiia bacterium]|nr:leucyl aminopeptidase [Acidimicrobiia bacterium]MBT8193145.1 leucyl aminopeptidase [Acidimicrobiia bacterium]NNF89235.1 leucyl aminopeptidase [Acidimicrobiia bacterium]NNL12296.1 leucyl aminopeptidase [Acidimicrobiia bacterium]RZV43152.1 MAG: leucyl aminopeptidase [Acidimicrobiia bacterium]
MTEIQAAPDLASATADVLVVPVLGERNWGPGGEWLAGELGDFLTDYLDELDFQGKPGSVASLPVRDRLSFKRLVLVGVGTDPDPEQIRQGAGAAGKLITRDESVATTIHQLDGPGSVLAALEGFLLSQYRFDKYRTEKKPSKLERILLIDADEAEIAPLADRARVIADAVNLARDLINEPPAAKSPNTLVEVARQIATTGDLDVTVYGPDQFEAERFGGLIGVAAGSHEPAAMIVLRHEPADPKGFIAIVGKGIVFDSGGLSLKPPSGMETMKTDMSGAAVVLATMQAIAALDVPVRVVGVTPVTENMPGGGAQRPGDVLTPRNGTTVEVLNTDAEGRLVLADALSLVAEEEPDLIVDAATLTGACPVALGEKIAGLWGNTDEAIDRVKAAASDAGEAVWHMPLPGYYRKNIDSDVADIKNTGTRYGGSINAALFLKEFVGEVPWAHLDIAGPARWPDDEHYQVKGGSGFGVRTLVKLIEQAGE